MLQATTEQPTFIGLLGCMLSPCSLVEACRAAAEIYRPDELVQAIRGQDAQIRRDPDIRDQDCFRHRGLCLLGNQSALPLRIDRYRLVGFDHPHSGWAYGYPSVGPRWCLWTCKG
jgi:hypothetical protein